MDYISNWRKSFAASFIVHLLLLPLLAYFFVSMTSFAEKNPEIVMDLSFDAAEDMHDGDAAGGNAGAAAGRGEAAPASDEAITASGEVSEASAEEKPAPDISPSEAVTPASSREFKSAKLSGKKMVFPSSAETLPVKSSAFGPGYSVKKNTNDGRKINGNSDNLRGQGVSSGDTGRAAENGRSGSGSGAETGAGKNGGGKSSDQGVSRPRVVNSVSPVYPEDARLSHTEGVVVLKVEILPSGHPGDIVVSQSSGYAELDQAAVTAMQQWQFAPARGADGQPFAVRVFQSIHFELTS